PALDGLQLHFISTHIHQSVALSHQLIEGLLILVRCQAMTGFPGGTTALFKDRRIASLPIDAISTHIHQSVALSHQLIESLLILVGCQAMTGFPGGTTALFKDRRIEILAVDTISVDEYKSITLSHQLIE